MSDAPKPRSAYGAAWRNIVSNLSIVAGERVVFGVVNLAAAAVATRAVGLEAFGFVVMLQAYTRLITGVVKLQSWKAVMAYGQPLLDEGRDGDFRRLAGLTLRLDLMALALALGGGLAGLGLAARLLDWPPEVRELAPWYVLTSVFIVSATPTGLLRLFDRFGVLSVQHALNATIRLAGAAAILWLDGGAFELALTWAAANVISGAYMMGVAFGLAARRGLSPRLLGRWGALSRGFDRIWSFFGITNATSLLDNLLRHATVLIVGAVLGPAAAALFAITRQFTEAMAKPGVILGPIIFPEIAKLEARGDRRSLVKLISRSVALTGLAATGVAAALILAGKWLLTTIFGPEAAAAYGLLVLTGTGSAILVWGFALEPTLLSLRRIGATLWTSIGATALFAILITALIGPYGLIGVGVALLARHTVLVAARATLVWRALADGAPPR